MVFSVLNAILRLEFLKNLQINFDCVLTHVTFALIYFSFLSCVLVHYLFDQFFLQILYHIFYCIVCFLFFFFFYFVYKIFDARLFMYLIAASLCSEEWQESFGMIVSFTVGLLYTINIILLSTKEMVTSRKLILFSYSSCIVKCNVGVKLLSIFKYSRIFVAICR